MAGLTVSPVALMLALLKAMRDPPRAKVARFRCKLCRAPVGPDMAAVAGCAVHPANNCSFGRKGATEYGPCAIPRFAAEPLGYDVRIDGSSMPPRRI